MRALGVSDPLLDEGLEELVRVVEAAREHQPGLLVADLKIARGLDYYTGTVYETRMRGFERVGSICSGGRYDNLATDRATDRYPGVGISLGVSRMLGAALRRGRAVGVPLGADLRAGRAAVRGAPARVRPDRRRAAAARHRRPRCRRPRPSSASRSGTPSGAASRTSGSRATARDSGGDEVKDIRSGEQVAADARPGRRPTPTSARSPA